MTEPEIINETFRLVCTKAAMFVGVRDYLKAMIWFSGWACGRAEALGGQGAYRDGIVHGDFRVFLADRFNMGKSLVWYHIPQHIPDWNTFDEQKKLDIVLQAWEDFYNPLTRMAAAITDEKDV